MTPAQRTKLKKALEAAKKELLEKAPRKLEPTRTDAARAGHDEDDQSLAEMNQAIASNRNKNDAQMVVRINKALQRLADEPEDFGNCQDCGDEIPLPRLTAAPWAEFCVPCQAERDGTKSHQRRKHLGDFI